MARRRWLAIALAAAIAIGGLWWWARRNVSPAEPPERTASPGLIATGAPFAARPIGSPLRPDERPQITHVAIADLDADGLADVLVCDALRNVVSWIRQAPRGTFTELVVAEVRAPAHVEPVDFDRDGDLDLLVAVLGWLFPNNNRLGSVIVYENQGSQRFQTHVLAEGIARVADARAADLDGDGDLDIAAAGFGYDDGETSWLENQGGWRFRPHILQRLSGPINSLVADINGDRQPDIVALVSQEWEEIWAFLGDGRGGFRPQMLWGSTNQDFGSSWISMADMDGDGDPDIVYSNGDAFEYAPPNSRPWQGVQWLENQGELKFELRRIVDLQGAAGPEAVDIDQDGDLDVMVVTANADWDDPNAPSLLWLENDGAMRFSARSVATTPTHLLTLASGDLDGDGDPDLVTGGMHISRPYDRLGRITVWTNQHGAPR
jgi:hypothetical protein